MKNLNFNQLKSVKTPESWIENVLNIPKKNKKPIYLKPSIIASAACFIVCCALSFVIFANVGTERKVPLYPADKTTSVADATENSDNYSPTNSQNITVPTNPNIQPIFDNPFDDSAIIPSTGITQIPTNGSSSQEPHTTQTNEDSESNSSTSTDSSLIGPTLPSTTEPSEKPTLKPDTAPTESPTQGSTQATAAEPSEPQTTVSLIVTPTEAEPCFTEPTTQESTTSGADKPNVSESVFYGNIFFIASENSAFNKSQSLYCHIEKADGTSYSEKWSYTELVLIRTDFRNTWYAKYTPKDRSIMLEKGNYNITFYDKNGNSVTGNFYLGDSSVHLYE